MAVPNVSEGRDAAAIEAIGAAFAPARLLDTHSDPDHGRSVFTLAGAAGRARAGARERRSRGRRAHRPDRAHAGDHPHVGAIDVAPVVYLDDGTSRRRPAPRRSPPRRSSATSSSCPCSSTASSPERQRERADIRRGGVAGAWRSRAELVPDYGPHDIDPRRAPCSLRLARRSSRSTSTSPPTTSRSPRRSPPEIRESAPAACRACAPSASTCRTRGCAQVSTNVHDYAADAARGDRRARRAARADGRRVELVGLRPAGRARGPRATSPARLRRMRHIENALGSRHSGWPRRRRSAGVSTAAPRPGLSSGRGARAAPSGGRPASRAEARDIARQKRQDRFDKEPTWRGSVNRAAVRGRDPRDLRRGGRRRTSPAGIVLGIVAMILYVPMSYYTDRALWRRRQRQKQQSRRR